MLVWLPADGLADDRLSMGKNTPPADTDAVRTALRPRMGKLSIAGGGVPPTTIPPHTHSADQISFEPAGLLASDDVQEAGEELDSEKLARDGTQPMLGHLDMNTNDVLNVKNMHVNGGVGQGVEDGVRKLSLTGAASDDEGKLDGLNREVFVADVAHASEENVSRIELNTAVVAASDYTPAEGIVSWDAAEGAFVAWLPSGTGLVKVALGWDVLRCKNGEAPI